MKKSLLIVIIILAALLILPLINFIRWTFKEKKPMDIILVDKTVPALEREKHKSFNWILANERFVKKEKKRTYSYKKDYYGFYPMRPLREKQWGRNDYRLTDLITLAEKNDAVYFADTYGVFFNDWYKGINKSRKSRKLYGGLNNNDFLLIKEMKDRNKLIIMEYNSFDYPTAQFESVRTQEKLGITFSGWTGKHFASLDTTQQDFPIWMTAMYRKQYKQPWTFRKSGIVILKEKEIVVLEEGTHLKSSMPTIITNESYCNKYGVAGSVVFDQWFDIIDPLSNNIISEFKIETTTVGDTLLLDHYLSSQFPAVVQDPVTSRIYYFSGDFAHTDVPVWTSRFLGVHKLKGLLYSDKPDDLRRFFWLYYRPLVNGIFSDYYESLNKK
ncbi:MAG: hypothetical protein A2X04_13500 [Bacteroidetes bacterium GWF2_41_9]|nr:MAG: hypothetical protein A2X06_07000 [Bacteroidetes bacterium GWC2_40_22]OFY57365.1 MAG: hypothetical protein A2X04_13500 [Bacteroidetes bacterium GWF2_41_9]HAM08885.1 hypothetical protein [Bacteroidales bacterium]HBH82921.1 hypothetical protein [Bacteroidales bacterium]HCU18534.1 hypothetical protein [Bacteroidales bacterium]